MVFKSGTTASLISSQDFFSLHAHFSLDIIGNLCKSQAFSKIVVYVIQLDHSRMILNKKYLKQAVWHMP